MFVNKQYIFVSILSLCCACLGIALPSCNKEAATYEDLEMYNSLTGIENFNLKANSKVMANLDSVFFAIDLENAVIFNADSLPKGTKVTTLVPVIKYNSSIKEITLEMSGGEYRTGIVNYIDNPSDSIDFSGNVKMDITAFNGDRRSYTIKVNVHKMEPDSIVWTALAESTLPSRSGSPLAQKTVRFNDSTYCLIQESDNSYTMAITPSATMDDWRVNAISFPADCGIPELRSFCATKEKMWLLTDSGNLLSSSDGKEWAQADSGWKSLTGAYGSALLGIKDSDTGLRYEAYPQLDGFTPYPMDNDFPLYESSNLCEFQGRWSTEPIVFQTGGVTMEGTISPDVWGFDGNRWTRMAVSRPPALTEATIVPYYVYIQTGALWRQEEISAWILIGGKKADGTINDRVYVSYDTGVNWHLAPELMQLPPDVPALYGLDNAVTFSPYSGSLSEAWQTKSYTPSRRGWRIAYDVDGYEISWDCPFIYLFGGYDSEGALNTTIRRGVLSRMTFIPVI